MDDDKNGGKPNLDDILSGIKPTLIIFRPIEEMIKREVYRNAAENLTHYATDCAVHNEEPKTGDMYSRLTEYDLDDREKDILIDFTWALYEHMYESVEALEEIRQNHTYGYYKPLTLIITTLCTGVGGLVGYIAQDEKGVIWGADAGFLLGYGIQAVLNYRHFRMESRQHNKSVKKHSQALVSELHDKLLEPIE